MTVPDSRLERIARVAPVVTTVTSLGDTLQCGDTNSGGFIP